MKNERTVYTTRGCFPCILFSSCNKKNENGFNGSYFYFMFFVWGLEKRKRMLSNPFSIFYYEIEKRKTKGRYIHGPFNMPITLYFHYHIWGCMCSTVVIFCRGCVSELCVTSYSVIYCIYISGEQGICFQLLCSLWWVQIIGYVLAWRSYSFICTLHHLIIIIVQTYFKTLNL